LIKILSSRNPVVFFLLVIFVFILRLPFFFYSGNIITDFYDYTCFRNLFVMLNRNHLSIYLIGCLIIIIQILHLAYIFQKHGVHYKSTYLPAFAYIIFASLFNGTDNSITPALVAQTPLMITLDTYFDLYKSGSVRSKIFIAMFMLGLGILVYTPFLYFIPGFLINIFFVKIPTFRDFATGITGVMIPLYFAFIFYYFSGDVPAIINKVNVIMDFRPPGSLEESISERILLAGLGLILLTAYFKIYFNHFKNIIKTRIIQQMFFVISLISVFILAFVLNFRYHHLFIFIIPFSYLFSYFFLGKRKFMMNDIIIASLLLIIAGIKLYIS